MTGSAAQDEGEVVDGVPVLAARQPPIVPRGEEPSSSPARTGAPPAAVVQAAAAAAGGFVAGAAVLGLVHRRQRRRETLARAQRRPRVLPRRGGAPGAGAVGELLQIVGTRSLLVDVHLLGGSSSQGTR
jgi:hypothetical protein